MIRYALPLLLMAGCGGNVPASTPGRLPAGRISNVGGVENLARLDTGVYRGAQPTLEGFRHLKELGIKTIVSLRSHHSEREKVESLGLNSIEIPLKADLTGSRPPTEEEIRRFFEIVLDPSLQPVFFHCATGKDRTGTLAALYRMEIQGWTPKESIDEMQAFGYHDIYKDLIEFVKTYTPRGYGGK